MAKPGVLTQIQEGTTRFLCYRTYFFVNNSYLCSVIRRENKKRCTNRFPKRGRHKTKTIMKKNVNEIMMLQYRIKRYQAMGNGAMCQALNGKLQKLLAQQA